MTSNRRAICAAAIFATLLVVWQVASPYWSAHRFLSAVQDDRAPLCDYFDYAQMRSSIETNMVDELAGLNDDEGVDSAQGMRATSSGVVAPAMARDIADIVANERGVRRLVQDGQPSLSSLAAAKPPPRPRWQVLRKGLGRFHLSAPNAHGRVADLVFEPAGLGWQLVGIDVTANQ
ncbi:MAG: DUF2939 domain-containing protein [Sphingopyxis sp.]